MRSDFTTHIKMGILTWYHAVLAQSKSIVFLWYGIVIGCIVTAWLLFNFVRWAIKLAWMYTSYFILKRLVYPHTFRRLRFIGAITRSKMLMGILYVSVNILCIIIPRASSAEISSRAATMSTINLIPLLCGPRLMLMSQLLGVSLRAHFGFHTWVATTAMVQALLHIVISVTSRQPVKLPGIIVRLTNPLISRLTT